MEPRFIKSYRHYSQPDNSIGLMYHCYITSFLIGMKSAKLSISRIGCSEHIFIFGLVLVIFILIEPNFETAASILTVLKLGIRL